MRFLRRELVWHYTSRRWCSDAYRADLCPLFAASPEAGLQTEPGSSSPAIGLRHNLLQIEASQGEPDTVDCLHSKAAADTIILVLRPEGVRGDTDLTTLILGQDRNGLDHAHCGRQACPQAGSRWSVLVCHKVVHRGTTEINNRCGDSGGSSFSKYALSDYDDSKKCLAIEPDNQEKDPGRGFFSDRGEHDDPGGYGDQRVDKGIIGKPRHPVWEILQPHNPHTLLNSALLLLNDAIGGSVNGRHIHDDEEEGEHAGKQLSEVILRILGESRGHCHRHDGGCIDSSFALENSVCYPVLEIDKSTLSILEVFFHFGLILV